MKKVVERRQRDTHHQAALMGLARMDNLARDVAQKITEVDAAALDVHRPAYQLGEDA